MELYSITSDLLSPSFYLLDLFSSVSFKSIIQRKYNNFTRAALEINFFPQSQLLDGGKRFSPQFSDLTFALVVRDILLLILIIFSGHFLVIVLKYLAISYT